MYKAATTSHLIHNISQHMVWGKTVERLNGSLTDKIPTWTIQDYHHKCKIRSTCIVKCVIDTATTSINNIMIQSGV